MSDNTNDGTGLKASILSAFVLLFALMILADIYLPLTCQPAHVTGFISYRSSTTNYGSVGNVGIKTEVGAVPVPYALFHDVQEGDSLIVGRSKLLGCPREYNFRGQIYHQGVISTYGQIPIYIVIIAVLISFAMREGHKKGPFLIWLSLSCVLAFLIICQMLSESVIGDH